MVVFLAFPQAPIQPWHYSSNSWLDAAMPSTSSLPTQPYSPHLPVPPRAQPIIPLLTRPIPPPPMRAPRIPSLMNLNMPMRPVIPQISGSNISQKSGISKLKAKKERKKKSKNIITPSFNAASKYVIPKNGIINKKAKKKSFTAPHVIERIESLVESSKKWLEQQGTSEKTGNEPIKTEENEEESEEDDEAESSEIKRRFLEFK